MPVLSHDLSSEMLTVTTRSLPAAESLGLNHSSEGEPSTVPDMPGSRRQNPQAFLCGSVGTMLFSGVPSVLVSCARTVFLQVGVSWCWLWGESC